MLVFRICWVQKCLYVVNISIKLEVGVLNIQSLESMFACVFSGFDLLSFKQTNSHISDFRALHQHINASLVRALAFNSITTQGWKCDRCCFMMDWWITQHKEVWSFCLLILINELKLMVVSFNAFWIWISNCYLLSLHTNMNPAPSTLPNYPTHSREWLS